MTENNLSAKDEALLILEYLENEHMSKTFLNFLDENKHLHHLRSRLYANYENPQELNDPEVNEFQTFFNLSKQKLTQLNNEQYDHLTFLSNNNNNIKTSNDLFFDDDFLNDLISQTPPMDYQPDTPIPSVLPIINNENEDFNSTMSSIEELFSIQHDTLSIPSHQIVQVISDINPTSSSITRTIPYTKCIVVTQDFLQSMCNQQSTITDNNINYIHRPKRRRRRLKIGKENYSQQRKLMPRTSP